MRKYVRVNEFVQTTAHETELHLLGRRLTSARVRRSLTREQVAEHLNLTITQYGSYEVGKSAIPVVLIRSLCEFLRVTPDYLLGVPTVVIPRDKVIKRLQEEIQILTEKVSELHSKSCNLRHHRTNSRCVLTSRHESAHRDVAGFEWDRETEWIDQNVAGIAGSHAGSEDGTS